MTTSEIKLSEIIGGGYDDFWSCEKRYRVLKGGKGSKKSATTALNFIFRLMKYKGSNLLVVRQVMNTHRDSTFAQLKWAQERLGVSHLWKNTVSPLEMVYINNTLTQSGANEVALGDSRADNATALMTMRNAAVMPLQIVKNRFYSFAEDIARIWADFWIACYGRRKIKLSQGKEIRYLPFEAERLKGFIINAKIEVGAGTVYSERECTTTLISLYEKGIIDRVQLLERLPDGTVPDKNGLISDIKEEKADDGL